MNLNKFFKKDLAYGALSQMLYRFLKHTALDLGIREEAITLCNPRATREGITKLKVLVELTGLATILITDGNGKVYVSFIYADPFKVPDSCTTVEWEVHKDDDLRAVIDFIKGTSNLVSGTLARIHSPTKFSTESLDLVQIIRIRGVSDVKFEKMSYYLLGGRHEC
jgi:hypothetical protein